MIEALKKILKYQFLFSQNIGSKKKLDFILNEAIPI
jgi:hypothetical protein